MGRSDDRSDEREQRLLQEVVRRAGTRLNVLEWVILAVAAGAATLGGALVSLVLAAPLGVPWRTLWLPVSLVLFVVPGWAAVRKARREDGAGGVGEG